MLHSTVLLCSERELKNKTVPFPDTEKVKLLEFRRLNPKLSTEALTNKVGLKVHTATRWTIRHSLKLHCMVGWLGKYAPVKLNFPFCKEKPRFGALLIFYN